MLIILGLKKPAEIIHRFTITSAQFILLASRVQNLFIKTFAVAG